MLCPWSVVPYAVAVVLMYALWSYPTILVVALAGLGFFVFMRKSLSAGDEKEEKFPLRTPNYTKDKVYLYTLVPCWNISDGSPFGVKLELWLKMAEIPYERIMAQRPGPRSKWPFIELNGETFGDTTLIIEKLTKHFNVQLDQRLTPLQKATSLLIQRTLEDHLYFAMMHMRWTREQWPMVKQAYFGTMPAILYHTIPDLFIRPGVIKCLYGQGLGRHSRKEVDDMAIADLEALDQLIGDQTYIHGDSPSSIDAVCFAFIEGVVNVPIENRAALHGRKLKRLVDYTDRIRQRFFPSLCTPDLPIHRSN